MALRIAFGSKAGTGKNTCAEYLQKEYGGKILKFATKVYAIADQTQQILGLSRKKDTTLLRFIGEGFRKLYGDDIWLNVVVKQIKLLSNETNIYITDLKYPNEFKKLKEMGFITVRVNRPIDRDPNAESEIALDNFTADFDFVINNDSSLEELYDQVEKIVKLQQHK